MGTHWDVEPYIAQRATAIGRHYGATWNTYHGHGEHPAAGERKTVDFWHRWRGDPLPVGTGDAIVAWVLGQHVVWPVRILIWYSWYWTPARGWLPYSGYKGNHGPGVDAHVHVGWE